MSRNRFKPINEHDEWTIAVLDWKNQPEKIRFVRKQTPVGVLQVFGTPAKNDLSFIFQHRLLPNDFALMVTRHDQIMAMQLHVKYIGGITLTDEQDFALNKNHIIEKKIKYKDRENKDREGIHRYLQIGAKLVVPDIALSQIVVALRYLPTDEDKEEENEERSLKQFFKNPE